MTSAGDGSGDVTVTVMVSAVMVTAVVAVMVTVIAVVSRPKAPVENFAGGYGGAIRRHPSGFSNETGHRPGVGPGAGSSVGVFAEDVKMKSGFRAIR